MNKKMLAVAVLSALLGGMLGAGSLYAGSACEIDKGKARVAVTMTNPLRLWLQPRPGYKIKNLTHKKVSDTVIITFEKE